MRWDKPYIQVITGIENVKFTFNNFYVNKEKKIYRKSNSENDYQLIVTTTEQSYTDLDLERKVEPYNYMVVSPGLCDYLIDVLFCTVNGIYYK